MNHTSASMHIPVSEEQQSEGGTRFSGRWLVLARFVWAVLEVIFFLLPTSSWNTENLLTSPTASQHLFIWVSIIG